MPKQLKVLNNVTYRVENRPQPNESDYPFYCLGDDGSTLELAGDERLGR